MTDRIVRPFRAWAEYNQCLLYLEWETDRGFRRYAIPTNGAGDLTKLPYVFFSVAAALKDDIANSRSLVSLRVLYENGYELKTDSREGMLPGTSVNGVMWYWSLSAPLAPGSVYALPGPVARGSFAEDRDHEAVERAMIAAAAWFSQAQPEGV